MTGRQPTAEAELLDIPALASRVARNAVLRAERARADDALHDRERYERVERRGEIESDVELDQSVERDIAATRRMSVVEWRAWRLEESRRYVADEAVPLKERERHAREFAQVVARWLEPTAPTSGAPLPISRRRAPQAPPRSRESAARALVAASDRVLSGAAGEREQLLGWASRVPGSEAVRAGWARASVAELLEQTAAHAGIDRAAARAIINRELEDRPSNDG